MIYVRFGFVDFITSRDIPLDVNLSSGDLDVGPLQKTAKKNGFILPAIKRHPYLPKKTKDNLLNFPDKIRIALEDLIEIYADMVAVSLGCKRRVSTPHPTLALIPETDREKDFLADAVGFVNKFVNAGLPILDYTFDLMVHGERLNGRSIGTAIISEALSNDHPSGKVHELIRFFENAFALSGRSLVDPMTAYFEDTAYNYTRNEIDNWIDIRDGVTHADRRKKIMFNGHSAWICNRLIQAAYDILLNKSNWHASDNERTEIWTPAYGASDADAGIFMTQGLPGTLSWKIFDQFRRFPLAMDQSFEFVDAKIWTGPIVDPRIQALPTLRTPGAEGEAPNT